MFIRYLNVAWNSSLLNQRAILSNTVQVILYEPKKGRADETSWEDLIIWILEWFSSFIQILTPFVSDCVCLWSAKQF